MCSYHHEESERSVVVLSVFYWKNVHTVSILNSSVVVLSVFYWKNVHTVSILNSSVVVLSVFYGKNVQTVSILNSSVSDSSHSTTLHQHLKATRLLLYYCRTKSRFQIVFVLFCCVVSCYLSPLFPFFSQFNSHDHFFLLL